MVAFRNVLQKNCELMTFISFKKVESSLLVFCPKTNLGVCELFECILCRILYINIDTGAFFLKTNVRDANLKVDNIV
jgi:hypothetical protein